LKIAFFGIFMAITEKQTQSPPPSLDLKKCIGPPIFREFKPLCDSKSIHNNLSVLRFSVAKVSTGVTFLQP